MIKTLTFLHKAEISKKFLWTSFETVFWTITASTYQSSIYILTQVLHLAYNDGNQVGAHPHTLKKLILKKSVSHKCWGFLWAKRKCDSSIIAEINDSNKHTEKLQRTWIAKMLAYFSTPQPKFPEAAWPLVSVCSTIFHPEDTLVQWEFLSLQPQATFKFTYVKSSGSISSP